MSHDADATKLAVLREAVERADYFAAAQTKTIETQDEMIALLKQRIKQLESEVLELRCAL